MCVTPMNGLAKFCPPDFNLNLVSLILYLTAVNAWNNGILFI